MLGFSTVVAYIRLQKIFLDQLSSLASHSGQLIEDNLRHEMVDSDLEGIQVILDTVNENDDFQIVYVMDTESKVVFAPNGEGIGISLDNNQPDCQPCHGLRTEERPSSVIVTATNGQRVFRSMQPIENSTECAECHDPNERILGLLLTDIPIAPFEKDLASSLRGNLFWWAGIILLTILMVHFIINRFVLLRLERLVEVISGFGQKESAPLLQKSHPDEIGQLVDTFNDMAQRVELHNEENNALSESLRRESARKADLLKRLISAQEDERKRVARELHDELGQSLAGLALQAEVLERFINSDKSRAFEQLNQIKDLIKETTDQMYDLILALRPSSLDHLGLVPALHSYADKVLDNLGIEFVIDAKTLSKRLPPEIETVVFRIIQEALSNVIRHANATKVEISLVQSNGHFEGKISDDGKGFDLDSVNLHDNAPRGLGMLGMQERVVQCGGQLKFHSTPGHGTKVYIRIPLTKALHG
jgi:signal transduction histidine kinase